MTEEKQFDFGAWEEHANAERETFAGIKLDGPQIWEQNSKGKTGPEGRAFAAGMVYLKTRATEANRTIEAAAIGDYQQYVRSLEYRLHTAEQKLQALQSYQKEQNLPEPYRTAICNILANGKAEP